MHTHSVLHNIVLHVTFAWSRSKLIVLEQKAIVDGSYRWIGGYKSMKCLAGSRSKLIVLKQLTIVDGSDRWFGGYKAADEVWRWLGSDCPMNATFDKWSYGKPEASGQYAQIETDREWDDGSETDHFICEVV
jgi:hypothetical protein